MRKKILTLTLCVSILAGNIHTGPVSAKKCSLKLWQKKISMNAGNNTKVRYKASGKVKAKITSGKSVKVSVKKKYIVVKAVKKGNSKIKVTCGSKKAWLKVYVKAKKVEEKPQSTEAPLVKREEAGKMAKYADSVNSFSNDMFASAKSDDNNTFVAPFSVYMALAILANGAADNTRTEMINALALDDLNDFNQSIEGYMKGSLDKEVTFNIANSLWFRKNDGFFNANIENEFINPVKKIYQAEIRKQLPFDNTTVKDINGWCDKKTNGMIKEVISTISPSDMLILVNALYFKGRWSSVFNASMTKEEDFHGRNKTSKVKMMHMTDKKFRYYNDGNFKGIAIPYGRNASYEMDVIMSADSAKNTGDVWKEMSSRERLKVFSKLDYSEDNSYYKLIKVKNLKLPKFKLDSGMETNDIFAFLNNKGIKDAFSPDNARFDKIARSIYIGNIVHKTALDVNEEGSEAAAVTVMNMCMSSAPVMNEEEIDFIIDRPFIFCIRDSVSGIILFVGEINDIQYN